MKRLVCCIITSTIILISSLTNAATVNAVSNEIGDFKQYTWNTGISGYKDGTWTTTNNDSDGWLLLTGTNSGTGINLGQSISVKQGDIATFTVVLVSLGGITNITQTPPAYCLLSSSQWVVVKCDTQFQFIEEVEYLYNYLYADLGQTSGALKGHINMYVNNQESTKVQFGVYTMNYTVRFSANDTTINRLQLDGVLSRGSGIWLGKISSISFSSSMEQGAIQANDQQKQEGQQAQQEGQTGSNASQETVDQGSQTMLQGAQTILGVITDTPAGNCNISGNMGNIDLGQLNFCEGNIDALRPIIRIIVNLVMGVATWKIFTFLLGTMVALFLSFTGGRKVDSE